MAQEETAKELESIIRGILNSCNGIDPKTEARLLVDDGWRKQQEGRWISVSSKPGVYAGMKCSICKAKISYRDYYSGQHNYCYKCGAKMTKEG